MGQVTVPSSTLREISFTHTMSSPPPTPSPLRRSNGSIYDTEILPAVLEILPFLHFNCLLSICCLSIMIVKRNALEEGFAAIIRACTLNRVNLSGLKQWRQKLLLFPQSIQRLDGRRLCCTHRNGLHILYGNVHDQ